MKYFFIFTLIFSFLLNKNLSAFYEVSIKNTNHQLTQEYFANKIINNLTDSSFKINDIEAYFTNFFFDNTVKEYHFEVNLKLLEEKFNSEGNNFNLSLLNCSLLDNFFELRAKHNNNCPIFFEVSNSKHRYIYIKNKNASFRIKKLNLDQEINLPNIWSNFLPIKKNFKRKYLLSYLDYDKLAIFLDTYPKIKSFEKGHIELEIEHYYSNEQINFLLSLL